MADFDYCINEAIRQKKISKEMGEAILQAENPDDFITEITKELVTRKRDAAIQATRRAQAWELINSHPDSLYHGLMALITKDIKGKAKYGNVEYNARQILANYDARIANMLSRFRTRTLGFTQDQKGLEDFVRARYGQKVDDAEIAGFSKDFGELAEDIRLDFNAAGGAIKKNESWVLPQKHDARLIEKAGLENWKDFIRKRLDRTKMRDDKGRILNDKALDEAMDYFFEDIRTNGMNKVEPFASRYSLGTQISRKGAEKRFFYFKDADSWLEYHKEFGRGDIFTTLNEWVSDKAHDIAMMKMFGTNPEATFNSLKSQINKIKKLTPDENSFLNGTWNVATGKIRGGEYTRAADYVDAGKNVLIAAHLGSAIFSSISDIGTSAITSKINNIKPYRVIRRQMELMNPANEADRRLAVRMGLTATAWKDMASTSNRFADVVGVGPTAKVREAVMRGSLLSPWTEAGRTAFGMEFNGMLFDNFVKRYDQLDPDLLLKFEQYGIDRAQWDKFRKTKPVPHEDGEFFADLTQDGGQNFARMVHQETDYAVPTPDWRVRAITTGGFGRATPAGMVMGMLMMYKSFPITMITTHLYRAATMATTADKLAYIGTLLGSMTLLGGVAIQLKDIATGKEPRPIDEKYIIAAIMQGGGLGIFGDLFFSDVNRFGQGLVGSLAGPAFGLIDDAAKYTVGNVQELLTGQETNFLGETAMLAGDYVPDPWQIRLLTTAIFDSLEKLADPDAERKFNRIMRQRMTEYDQGYWWRPGEPLPEALQ